MSGPDLSELDCFCVREKEKSLLKWEVGDRSPSQEMWCGSFPNPVALVGTIKDSKDIERSTLDTCGVRVLVCTREEVLTADKRNHVDIVA